MLSAPPLSAGSSSAKPVMSVRVLPPTRIALLIDRLNIGGAERQFVVLADALQQNGHSVVALVFYPDGPLEADLRASRISTRVIGKRGRWDVIRFSIDLIRALRHERPSVLLCYSGVPNLLGILAKPFLSGTKIVWVSAHPTWICVGTAWCHRSSDGWRRRSRDTPISSSRTPTQGSRTSCRRRYSRRNIVVVPNGIDTDRFARNTESRARLRREWDLIAGEKVIGIVGRLDPMKDHQTFLQAASLLARQRNDVRFVCVGEGAPAYCEELQAAAARLGLKDRLLWLPNQVNMPEVYNALDILCSSSAYGEGFPNVLGEAMSCGVPCVVTSAGDAGEILGQPQWTVTPGDASALAKRLADLVDSRPEVAACLRTAGRERIVRKYSIARLVQATEQALASVLLSR